MNCPESRAFLIEFARSGIMGPPRDSALAGHLRECSACSRFLDDQLALDTAFASLASQLVSAPAGIEARVLAQFDAAAGNGARQSRWWFSAWAAALVASMIVAAFLIQRPAPVLHSAEE